MKGKLTISIIVFALMNISIQDSMAQSVTGIPGYVRIPSAHFMDEKSLLFGVSFLPKEYLNEYHRGNYNAGTAYTSLTFLPFLEVNFRLTQPLGYGDKYSADRMPSVRLRLIKEKKWYPSIALGVHDFAGTGLFRSSYIVCTKGFKQKDISLNIEGTLGYGTTLLKSKYNGSEFVGFFGGVSLNWEKIKWINMMIEYDRERINVGSSFLFFERLRLLVGLQGADALTGTISYKISL